jgi:1-acyl-sn-glycerol-3-phosphate acyltransferase
MGNILTFLNDKKYAKWLVLNWLLSVMIIEWALYKYNPLKIRTKKD